MMHQARATRGHQTAAAWLLLLVLGSAALSLVVKMRATTSTSNQIPEKSRGGSVVQWRRWAVIVWLVLLLAPLLTGSLVAFSVSTVPTTSVSLMCFVLLLLLVVRALLRFEAISASSFLLPPFSFHFCVIAALDASIFFCLFAGHYVNMYGLSDWSKISLAPGLVDVGQAGLWAGVWWACLIAARTGLFFVSSKLSQPKSDSWTNKLASLGLHSAEPLPPVAFADPDFLHASEFFIMPALDQKRRVRMIREGLHRAIGTAVRHLAPLAVSWCFVVFYPLRSGLQMFSLVSCLPNWLVTAMFNDMPLASFISHSIVGILGCIVILLSFNVPSIILSEHFPFSTLTARRESSGVVQPLKPRESASTEAPSQESKSRVRDAVIGRAALSQQRQLFDPLISAASSSAGFVRMHALKDVYIGAAFLPEFRRALFGDASQQTWRELFDTLKRRIDGLTQHLQLKCAIESGSLKGSTPQFRTIDILFGSSSRWLRWGASPSLSHMSLLFSEVTFAIKSCAQLIVHSRDEDVFGVVNVCRSAVVFLESLLSLQIALDMLVGGSLFRRRIEAGSVPANISNAQKVAAAPAEASIMRLKEQAPDMSGYLVVLPHVQYLSMIVSEAVHDVLLEFYEEIFQLHDFRSDHQTLLQYYADMCMN